MESSYVPHADEKAKLVADAGLATVQAEKEHWLAARAKLEFEDFQQKRTRNKNGDLQNRVYNFLGPIQLATVDDCANTILSWDRESREPITLRLMSPGGEVPAGLYLYDLLTAITDGGTQVTTVAIGNANSMAAVVLQAGTRRLIGPNSWITLHEVSVSGTPFEHMTVTEKEEQDQTIRRINNRLVRILARRATLTEKQIGKKINKRDWTLEPEEAIGHGFADGIGYR